MKTITSAANPRFRTLLLLLQSSRERRKAGLSLLDGTHLIRAYHENLGLPEYLVVSKTGLTNPEVVELLDRLGTVEVFALSDALFGSLSSVATPTGIIATIKTPRIQELPEDPGACVLLHEIQDPGNLGSILRTAAAAGIREIFLSPNSVQCWSPRVLRAGMGAHFMLSIFENVDLIEFIGNFQGKVVATSGKARNSVFSVNLTGRIGLLLGNEGNGLSRELLQAAHETCAIPMPGNAESLNVAAAAAILLFERVRQLGALTH
jgi:TrmH family RNA methyltransferase